MVQALPVAGMRRLRRLRRFDGRLCSGTGARPLSRLALPPSLQPSARIGGAALVGWAAVAPAQPSARALEARLRLGRRHRRHSGSIAPATQQQPRSGAWASRRDLDEAIHRAPRRAAPAGRPATKLSFSLGGKLPSSVTSCQKQSRAVSFRSGCADRDPETEGHDSEYHRIVFDEGPTTRRVWAPVASPPLRDQFEGGDGVGRSAPDEHRLHGSIRDSIPHRG